MAKYNNGQKLQQMQQPAAETGELRVTTLRDLERYRQGNIVELPPFGVGQPFVARLKRPSMLTLAKNGMIPNALLSPAARIFYKGSDVSEEMLLDHETLAQACNVFECIAEASLIEPTLADIKKVGMSLTDEQLMFIFNYSQRGVKALESFRRKPEDAERPEHVE